MSSVDPLLDKSIELARAHLSVTPADATKIPGIIEDIYRTLKRLADGELPPNPEAGSTSQGALNPGLHIRGATPLVVNSDISGPEFEGLDTWLAARLPPRIVRRLNKEWTIHPSVFPDHLICLEDGENVKLLRAYLKKRYNLSFAEYLDRWNLPDNYPAAPPDYLTAKRATAKAAGLGVTTRGARGPAKKHSASARKAETEA